jgi:hypothetical protein
MKIKGLLGDEKWKLRPDVWVEVYELGIDGSSDCEYVDIYEVKDLTSNWLLEINEATGDDRNWEDFGLRPIERPNDWDEDFSGFVPIEITKHYSDAYTDEWNSLIPFHNKLS